MNTKKYVVKVNNVVVSAKLDSPTLAEDHIKSLPPETRGLAEVVVVDNNGKEFLFG